MPMYASFCYNLILHFHLIKYKDYASYAEGCKTFLTRFYKSSYIVLWLQKYKSFNNIYDLCYLNEIGNLCLTIEEKFIDYYPWEIDNSAIIYSGIQQVH